MTFWPNPVYRNHTGEMRWYFNVAVRETASKQVQLVRYRGEWYDMTGRLLDSKEDGMDIRLGPQQHVSYPELWVTSAVPRFQYRLIVMGYDTEGQEVRAEGMLACQ